MCAAVKSDEFEIRVPGVEDGDRVMEFLLRHYYQEEPLTVGCEPPEPDEEDKKFLRSNLSHGTCLIMLQNDRIVAAAVAGPKDASEVDILFEYAAKLAGTKWGRILGILALAERGANVFHRYNVDKALHLHAIGVDAQMRGRALGERLVNAIAALAKKLGYPLLTADCSSFYSSRLLQRLGFQMVNRIPYTEYVDAAGEQIILPPAPHQALETLALRV